jgi:oxalyl-CoA decarboxylase
MTTETQGREQTDGFNVLIDALQANDLNTIYGLVGIPITDLARLAQARGMRFIGFRHEANAVNAAAIAGYMTKKPGLAMTVSAPGFLNGLVALANATVNCFPMIMISGSSEREVVDLAQGDYEELDQLNAAKPYVKAAYRINHIEDIGIAVARAIRAAVSGRPGGVYLDVPAKLLGQAMDAAAAAKSIVKVVDPAPAQIPAPDAVARALDVLKSAKRPVIMLGKGAAYAQVDADIRAFVEKTGIPYLAMSMAKGLLPDNHPQAAVAARSFALKEADCVMLIGARLNWLLSHGKGPTWGGKDHKDWAQKKFVQIDISAQEMDSNVPIDAPLAGDIGSTIAALLKEIDKSGFNKPDASWTGAIAEKKEANIAKMAKTLAATSSPMNFMTALSAMRDVMAKNQDICLVNEGANTLDLARSVIDMYQPRKRLDSGTWGVMGIGMGYAIAAAVETNKPVVALEGDSAFGFSGMEVETICRYNLPVTVVIFNNNGVYRGCDVNPTGHADPAPTVFVKGSRYEMLMQAFGGVGVTANTPEELKAALEEGISSRRPTLINVVIDEKAGTESGRIAHLNPTSAVKK